MSAATTVDSQFLLQDLLRDVSRSFYLTLKLLPGSIREQIGLAYLLARATDTIADTGAVSVEERLAALQELRIRILDRSVGPIQLPELRARQSSDAERILLERVNEVLTLLDRMEEGDRELIQRVLETITSGQELDLKRFGNASATRIVAIQNQGELDDYTYRVAGCVGEFWTHICLKHLRPLPKAAPEELVANGIRFGQGLQLVNILRDVPVDLRMGRCYLPEVELAKVRLTPKDLLDPTAEERLRPVYQKLLTQAEGHLSVGWSYVLSLPRSWVRLRLACALPILIGVKTLNKLRAGNVLNPDTRIKVSRQDIQRIMRANILFYPVNSLWKKLPTRVARS